LITAAMVVAAVEGRAEEKAFPPAIEDNSFLLEEAYNQDAGVVQHIATFVHFRTPVPVSDLAFTQEWPLGGQRHQISYSIPYSWVEGDSGFRSLLLNYRLQLVDPDRGIAVAPRLSLIVPSGHGDATKGGLQTNVAFSRRTSAHLALHANLGGTLIRRESDALASSVETRTLNAVNVGAGIVGMVTPTFNVMVEGVVASAQDLDGDGRTERSTAVVVAPGLRLAINRGSLQIVYGAGAPITFADDRTDVGGYLYLSFEHAFKKN
jgi:hypothetical protein